MANNTEGRSQTQERAVPSQAGYIKFKSILIKATHPDRSQDDAGLGCGGEVMSGGDFRDL